MEIVLQIVLATASNLVFRHDPSISFNLILVFCQGARRKSTNNKDHVNAPPEEEISTPITEKVFMGGSADGDPTTVAAARLRLTKMLGELASYIVQPIPNGYKISLIIN